MRRRTLVVAGAATAAALLVGTAGVVALSRPDATAAAPAVVPAPAAVESACGLAGSPGTQGAAAATWTTVGAYVLPVSPTDGPGTRVPAGPWSCFARTPSGAVLAGITIGMRVGGVAENWQDVAREQTMPGVGQTTILAKPLPDAELVTVRGFDVAGYTPDRATIRYYLHTPTTDASCTTEVEWSAGDWRLVLGDDGSTSSGCTQGAPDNFTPWGP